MRAFIRKHQRTIGLLFIGVAVVLFADKAIDLGAEAAPMLAEIMLGVVLFAVGYAFVVHPMRRLSSEDTKDDE